MSRLLYLLNWHIEKKPAYNGRFGASGAVARLKVCANFQVLCPSERQCKPRLRQVVGTLGEYGRQSQRKTLNIT